MGSPAGNRRAADGKNWIRLDLKGERRLGDVTNLFFRYRLSGTDNVRVEVRHRKSGFALVKDLKDLKTEAWSEADVSWDLPRGGKAAREPMVGEIRFILSTGELLVDDVLLYVPGTK